MYTDHIRNSSVEDATIVYTRLN